MLRLYLAVEPDPPDSEGFWLVLVWEDDSEVPAGVRYGDIGSLYRGARRILDRYDRGTDPLKQLRQDSVRRSLDWRRRLGRRVDLSDEARLLHGAGG